MKKLIKVSFLALAVLAALAGCELYNAINVAWSIDGWSYNAVTDQMSVTYTVQNMGKFDLTGVNLQIGVDVAGNGTYPNRAWTPDFDLRQNQVKSGAVSVFVGSLPPLGGATVLSVDMNNPKGST